MIMDRQTIIAISLAIGFMLFFAGVLFGPRGRGGEEARATYSPGDVRYNLQQADAKDRAKRRKDKRPAKEQFVTDGSTSSGGDDNASDESAEEPSAEEPDAEEPPIE